MGQPRIGIHDAGLSTESRHNPVDRPQRHRMMAIAQKHWPRFPTADEHEQVAEVVVIDDRNDPGFAAFTLMDSDPFALCIEVPHIEMDEFTAANAKPPERFDQTSIPKIAGAQEQFSHVSGLEVIGRGGKLVLGYSHGFPGENAKFLAVEAWPRQRRQFNRTALPLHLNKSRR